ncbi:hypothetical protein [Campylobacter concisus]|jgi:hypothetical protein|uniref:hypothetical protein n=1 Tax=Campylobacter concisus TaxID=199 RepID=UPI001F45A391|nr:hypothetical protein [Campylobacter concisus]
MAEELTQDQLAEWSYLKEQEMVMPSEELKQSSVKEQVLTCKEAIDNTGIFKSNETGAVACAREFYTAYGSNDDNEVREAINNIYKTDISAEDLNKIKTLTIREMDMDLKENFDNEKEYTIQDINRKFIFETAELKLNKNLNEAVNTLEEKEKIDEQIKAKEAEFNEFKSPKEKRDFVSDKLNEIDGNDTLKSSLEILKEKEKIDEQIKAKEAELENKNEAKQDIAITTHSQEREAEQEDWSRKADELENQHEKELEKLRDEQSRLEANFQKSIDNLMNSGDIKDIMTALQEMDRSLEMMMRQGKEESETKERQRQEKLELAFDSPKFKDAVGDLVKEVYKQRKEVKGGLKELENEHANYAKLKTTYEKEIKKGLDIKGYEKLNKMLNEIEKETPNFKNSYPKFYKKVNDSLAQSKEKILNKTKEKDQEQSRSL